MPTDFLKNKIILVTGGTGSFGRSFVEFLLKNSSAKKVIVFSRDELKQSRMQSEINDERLRFFLGDVRDLQRLQRALRGVDFVVHAAALKQVPTLEYNPFEAIKTNTLGSQNVVDAAIDQGVERAVLVSTDKAAMPINLYGATKLCAEKIFTSGNAYTGGKTKFACVRYGNVIGSRGSVVEILCRNRSAKKVFLTDEQMTRFWITLEETFSLVLFALQEMAGGEIFIPKIPSMKVADLFGIIVPEAEIEIVGIRAGEKLHETLLTPDEARHSLELEKYYVVIPESKEVFRQENFQKYYESGKALPDNFSFRSHKNENWLTRERVEEIIENLK